MQTQRINRSDIEKKLIDVGIALTETKDFNHLLEKIVTEARNITNADGGTLYLVSERGLEHRIMKTTSLGIDLGAQGEHIEFSPLEMSMSNIAAYCAMTAKVSNIEDVYHSDLFDFSGPRKFDQRTGYTTKSMLVFPLISRRSKIVGVLQLVNAQDAEGNVISFDPVYEEIVLALASQAGISIENMGYMEEIRQLFESFVQVIAKTIDERTPYNSEHSENLARYLQEFALYLNSQEEGPYQDIQFSEADLYELMTAAWLHDVGKIVVPLEILDKPTRLAHHMEATMARYDLIEAKLERNHYKAMLEQDLPEEAVDMLKQQIIYMEELRQFVLHLNKNSTFVDSELLEKLKAYYKDSIEGIEEPLITEDEFVHLSIYRGTLTTEERKSIENHVTAGARILSEMAFPEYLSDAYEWIRKHHEFLNGSGYPEGLTAKDIPLESRMMTILDIYDALVERNRPYKEAIPKLRAISILRAMATENKLDKDLVEAFIDSGIWEAYE